MSNDREAARRPSKFRFTLVVAVIIALLALLAWRFGAAQVVAAASRVREGCVPGGPARRTCPFPNGRGAAGCARTEAH